MTTSARFRRRLRSTFLAGLAVLMPLVLTYLILRFLYNLVNSLLGPVMEAVIGWEIPGQGVVATILLVLLAGALTTNIVGRKIVTYSEALLLRIPLVKNVYASSKQFLEAFTLPGKKAYRQVVLIEYPRLGAYALGFLTGDEYEEFSGLLQQPTVNVYVPTAPNPTAGFVLVLPKKDIIPLQMTVEEGIKLIVSGGIILPTRGKGGHP